MQGTNWPLLLKPWKQGPRLNYESYVFGKK